jgi:hypothetical protein
MVMCLLLNLLAAAGCAADFFAAFFAGLFVAFVAAFPADFFVAPRAALLVIALGVALIWVSRCESL